jgi:hypothetical protein
VRIDAIHIENFLSFDTFTWERIDPALNVIVGPNGAGKTNLFHAVCAMCAAVHEMAGPIKLAWNADLGPSGWMWEHMRYRRDDSRPTCIAIDLAFTTEWERDVLATFIAASLHHPQAIQAVVTAERKANASADGLRAFADWLERRVPSAISWLLKGRLVITSSDGGRSWDCQFESRQDTTPFWWNLHTPGIRGQVVPATGQVPSLFGAWREQLPEDTRNELDLALAGSPDGRFPSALHLNDLPLWAQPADYKPLGGEKWSWAGSPPRLYQHLERLLPFHQPGWNVTSGDIWSLLLAATFVFTDNVRAQPRTTYTMRALRESTLDLSDGKDLAAFLHRNMNGGAAERAAYKQIQDMFFTVTGRRCEVVESLQAPPATTTGEESEVALELVTAEAWGDVALTFSGAGIAEALYFCALAVGSEGRVILLDEPALNLHPTLMTALLKTMGGTDSRSDRRDRSASQFLVSTHSPWLIPSDAIDQVARFTLFEGHTTLHTLHDPSSKVPNEARLMELCNLLRKNPAARALLFSRAVILVEGETEQGALSLWWDLDRHDIALYSVGGKGEFVSPIKFLECFAIPWAVLCDGDAIWDRKLRNATYGAEHHVQVIMRAANKKPMHASGDPGIDSKAFARWRKRLEQRGVFTLASSADEAFERAIQAVTPDEVWQRARVQFNRNNVAVGRYVGEQCSCPAGVMRLLARIMKHLRQQGANLDAPLASTGRSGNS